MRLKDAEQLKDRIKPILQKLVKKQADSDSRQFEADARLLKAEERILKLEKIITRNK